LVDVQRIESMAWYLKALWHHDFAEEPVEIFGEVGDDGYEIRKVHVFRGGRLEWTNAEHEEDMTGLGQMPVPPVSEINEGEEFAAEEIAASLFEAVWGRALAATRDQSGS
jgi:hypothetical protein